MPPQQARPDFVKAMGSSLNKTVKDHARDETVLPTGGQIPAGIDRGIAQLTECYFDKYKTGGNAGKWHFYAVASCLTPETIATPEGVKKCRGLHTRIRMLLDEGKDSKGNVLTRDHNTALIMNRMRILGGDEIIDDSVDNGAEELNRACQLLSQAKPKFYFSTSVRKALPKPDGTKGEEGVWENWYEAASDDVVEQLMSEVQSAGMDDQGGEEQQVEETPEPTPEPAPVATKKPSTNGTAKSSPKPKEPELPDDPDELVKLIDAGGDTAYLAQDKLEAIYFSVTGKGKDDFDAAPSFQAIADEIKNPTTADDGSHEEPSHEWYEVEGTPCYTQVWNGRTKKVDKSVECEIIKYDPKDNTVVLKDIATGKVLDNPQTKKPMGPVSLEKIQQVPY